VPLTPVPKGRPRVFNGRAVTPAKTRKYEELFALFAAENEPEAPIESSVALRLRFYLPRPKRLMRRKDPDGPIACPKRPDLDNLVKSSMDALARWWRDDAQIVELAAAKFYCERHGMPRIEVEIDQA